MPQISNPSDNPSQINALQLATAPASYQLGAARTPFFSDGFSSTQFRSIRGASHHRLVWFPQGLPAGRAVLIASSRLGTKLDELDDWFDALRTLAVRLNPATDFFITSEGLATDPFVRHLARRFGFSVLELIPWNEFAKQSAQRFLQETLTIGSAEREDQERPLGDENSLASATPSSSLNVDPTVYQAFVLDHSHPVLDLRADNLRGLAKMLPSIKSSNAGWDRDTLLIQIAAECFLLSVRPHGKVHQAALDRLDTVRSKSAAADHRTWILVSEMTQPSLREELESAGAIGWWLYPSETETERRHPVDSVEVVDAVDPGSFDPAGQVSVPSSRRMPACHDSPKCVPLIPLEEFPAEKFLIHWTRYRVGPWPEQTQEQWLDDLLFRFDRRKHGPACALRRILATRQILASRQLTRDNQPVVCLSNRSLRELDRLTVFRQHLGRWDFVPFGIAIDRDWLHQHGARPVIYGDEDVWQALAECDRPFFQLACSKSGKVDWTIEQEWRWLGNLNLRKIPPNCVAAFVPDASAALAIEAISGWPIVILQSAQEDAGRK